MSLVIPPREELCGDGELGRSSGLPSSWNWEFFLLLSIFYQLAPLLQTPLLVSLVPLNPNYPCVCVLGEE